MSLLALAAAVFLASISATGLLVWRMHADQARALARLLPEEKRVAAVLPSAALIWTELVSRVGLLAPGNPKDLPRLRRRLVSAGFRHPDAPRLFRGMRVIFVGVFLLAGVAVGIHSGAGTENFLYLLGAAGVFGRMAPTQYLQWRIRRRQRAIEKGLPNALDLMVVCVESGLGLDQTILQVSKELQSAHPEICDEFTVMNIELRAGKRRAEALHNLGDRVGVEDLRKLVAVLVQTDRFGTSIAQTLRSHADYMRTMARQRAEERAAKLPVKLVFPIFFFILPSLFVVILGPIITRLGRELLPMIQKM